VVALLVGLPLLVLPGQNPDQYAELEARIGRPVVVRYDSYGSAIKSLDPATCGDVASSSIQANVWESLYAYHYLIRPSKVVPQLAAAMPKVSADRLTYTIQLRPGVKYHRNPCFGLDAKGKGKTRTVRAEDFVLAFKRIADYMGRADLSWTFLSDHVAGIDAFRERTQGLPDEVKDAFAAVDGWLGQGQGKAGAPRALAGPAKQIAKWYERWGKRLHVDKGIADALAELDRWCALAAGGSGKAVNITPVMKVLAPWRQTMRGFDQGDFSRFDQPVEGVKALDELTLQIKLVEPFPQFIYVLAMHVYAPVPREAVDYWFGTEDDGKEGRRPIPAAKQRSTEFIKAEQLVGTGPYRLKIFKRKQKIVFVRSADYRGDRYPSVPTGAAYDALTDQEKASVVADQTAGLYADAGKPVPFIDVMEYDFVEEDHSRWMRFLAKQTDASGIPKETFEYVITPDKELAESWRKRNIYLKKYASPAIYWIVFNMEDPVLGSSKSLRQALNLAFDRRNYIRVLMNGRARRADNIIPSTFSGHTEAGRGAYAWMDVAAAKKKIVQAKAELAEAGKLKNGEVPELKLDIGGSGPATVRMTDFIKQQFAKVGVRLKVVFNDWPTQQRKVRNKQAQMYTMGWHADYPDAENFLQLYYSPNIKAGTNSSHYKDEEFDKEFKKART
ncbi:hypothetical protein LCGC14_2121170, partial [marine sediment metagenome]